MGTDLLPFDEVAALIATPSAIGILLLASLYLSQLRDVQRLRAWMEQNPEYPVSDLALSESRLDKTEVELEHLYVDAASFELLRAPRRFDVVAAENLFGDILSDEIAAVVGSPGLLPSASLGDGPFLYEAILGPGPALAGRAFANPAGAMLAAAMMLEHSFGLTDLARAVEMAVAETLRQTRTHDLGGTATTVAFTAAVLGNLSWVRSAGVPEGSPPPAYEWGV